jgi:hypothetical protein
MEEAAFREGAAMLVWVEVERVFDLVLLVVVLLVVLLVLVLVVLLVVALV